MHIRRIKLDNIRCFRSVDLDLTRPDGSLAGWTVVAGRNGSGKTTLLQAIAMPVVDAIEHHSGSWFRHGERTAAVRAWMRKGPRDTIRAVDDRGEISRGFDWQIQTDGSVTYGWNAVPLISHKLEPYDCFLAAYGPFRRLSGHATDAQRLMSDANPASRFVTLFREDASLAESVQWLREVYLRRLEGKHGAKELEEAALSLLRDGLLPGGLTIEKVDSDGLWVRGNGSALPLTELSDGYRTVTALILDIVRHMHAQFGEFRLEDRDGSPVVPYDGVVLIDEVDSHLHVSWQQQIGFWLKCHFPNIQFIVTTHSPFICQAADPRGIIRLPGPGEEGTPEHVSDDLYHTIVNGTVDDAVMTELFGLEHPYSDASEGLRKKVAELEFKLIRGGLADEEQRQLEELSEQLPKTGSAAVERALRKLQGA